MDAFIKSVFSKAPWIRETIECFQISCEEPSEHEYSKDFFINMDDEEKEFFFGKFVSIGGEYKFNCNDPKQLREIAEYIIKAADWLDGKQLSNKT